MFSAVDESGRVLGPNESAAFYSRLGAVTDGSCNGKCGWPSCSNIEIIPEGRDEVTGEEILALSGNVASTDFLAFQFRNRRYRDQVNDAVRRTKQFCAVSCHIKGEEGRRVLWLTHHFEFMGGSLGCAEGEVLCQGFEYARDHRIPVVVEARSGGARIQEGTLSLMQMAKVSVAVQSLHNAKVPFISICRDPTYGGVSASYAMQSDIRIAMRNARIGFAGPNVIVNTVYEQDQDRYDEACPRGFQTGEFLSEKGQIDVIVDKEEELPVAVDQILDILWFGQDISKRKLASSQIPSSHSLQELDQGAGVGVGHTEPIGSTSLSQKDYLSARELDRYQSQDFVSVLFDDYLELKGDGRVGIDACIRGGLAFFCKRPVVVVGMYKGHDPVSFKDCNYGMPTPHGYRFALRMMKLAQHFDLPVVTFVDTVGAYPSFESEIAGQFEAIATNLRDMAALKVPIISVVVGEGGSGGALGVAMGNRVGMLSNAWYSVISPEGAASILGRYEDEGHKARQFPIDCQTLAQAGHVYAEQLLALGVIDEIVIEGSGETCEDMPKTVRAVKEFLLRSLKELSTFSDEELVEMRYRKFRNMGKVEIIDLETRMALLASNAALDIPPAERERRRRASQRPKMPESVTLRFIADVILHSTCSAHLGLYPKGITLAIPPVPTSQLNELPLNAKLILDRDGPEAVAKWVRAQKRVLVTDTTMRDAHQSLLATRMRTIDMLNAASEYSNVMHDAFSLECWGGATFDVAMRFLHEDPWERLRLLRKAIPNICLQMLVRSNNVVGYTNYPQNLVTRFVELAAEAGIDVFRIFDCFNDLDQMQLTIDAVRKTGKIAEVCVCFTGNFLDPNEKIYTLDYYRDMTRKVVAAGAHMIAIKDMAGLLRPQMAAPLMAAMREEAGDLPIHFHTHNTSGAALSTAIRMTEAGCDVIDFAFAALADTTSQPSLNAFLASMEGVECDPGINYLSLEKLDVYWDQVRSTYRPLDSSAPMQTGSARVYDHQIPGGQYSNLLVQCKSLGLYDRWADILDMYRDCNKLFGDVIKVTPSSKVIGDMALYMIKNNLTIDDVRQRADSIQWPQSTIDFCRGKIGFPHRGIPEDIQRLVLKGEEPPKTRPVVDLADYDFEEERVKLQEQYGHNVDDYELVAALLYPVVHPQFVKHQEDNGKAIPWLPTNTFFYGMSVGEVLQWTLPARCDPTLLPYADHTVPNQCTIALKRVSAIRPDGTRLIVFLVNGEAREVTLKDRTVEKKADKAVKADPNDQCQLPSPLPGTIDKIRVRQGDTVAKGDVIVEVGAMKMEVHITCPFESAIVKKIVVNLDQRVDTGSLVAILEQQ